MERQQSGAPGAQQGERIQIALAAQQSPVQAAARTVIVPLGQCPDRLAGRHRGAHGWSVGDREVAGPQRRLPGARVQHRDQRPPRHQAREGDHSGQRGPHRVARFGGEVDPAVPGGPRLRWRLEPAQHPTGPADRPGPPTPGPRHLGAYRFEPCP
jgi:hypothetical protein